MCLQWVVTAFFSTAGMWINIVSEHRAQWVFLRPCITSIYETHIPSRWPDKFTGLSFTYHTVKRNALVSFKDEACWQMGISCTLWTDFVRIHRLVTETMVSETIEGPWLINNGKLANPWTITNSDERHCSSLDVSQQANSLRLTCLASSLSRAVLAWQVLKCKWSPRSTREHLSKWPFAVDERWHKTVKVVSTVSGNIINICLGAWAWGSVVFKALRY